MNRKRRVLSKTKIFAGVLMLSLFVRAESFYDMTRINTIDLVFVESNWDQILDDFYAAGQEQRLEATVTINGVPFPRVGVRYKGNSSYNSRQTKNPFNIKLDYVNKDQKLDGYGTLKLSNVYKDPTFVREVISYQIARKYMPASLANFAQVSVNGKAFGLYVSVQSVDKAFLREHFEEDENAFFKGEISQSVGGPPVNSGKVWGYLGTDESVYTPFYELKSEEGWSELIQFLDVFNNQSEQVESVLNVDRLLWMLAFDILMVNLDSPVNFGHNFYLYKDTGGLFNPLIWDLNENFGGFSLLLDQGPLSVAGMQQMDPFLNSSNPNYPIVSKILSNPVYKKMYVAHMKSIIKDNFTNGWFVSRIDQVQSTIDSYVQSDPEKFYTYADFKNNVNYSSGTGPQSIIGIMELMDARIRYINETAEFKAEAPVFHSQSSVIEGTDIVFIASASYAQNVYLFFRGSLTGPFSKVEMLDDGNHGDGDAGDGVYGISIVGTGFDYYFFASNQETGMFYPENAASEYFSNLIDTGVVINEVLAHSHGEEPDWIEILNTSDQARNIGGWLISDDKDNLGKYRIADGTILEAHGFLVLYENTNFGDASMDSGRLEPFGLSENGEHLYLSQANHQPVDDEDFGASETNVSLGRYHKASTDTHNFVALVEKTPGRPNSEPLIGPLVVSEIMYHPSDDTETEFLELTNISGTWLTLFDDTSGQPWKITEGVQFSFPADNPVILSPNEQILLVKNEQAIRSKYVIPETIRLWVWDSGSLSNSGEKIEISKPGDVNSQGERQYIRIDRVTYQDEAPWPLEADAGLALERLELAEYGNDPINWKASEPSPGWDQHERTALLYPWISNRAGQFESTLIANNLNKDKVTITMVASRPSGGTQKIERTLAGMGFLVEKASSLFPELGSGDGYSVILTALEGNIQGNFITSSLGAASGQSPAQGVAINLKGLDGKSQRSGTEVIFGYLPISGSTISAPVLVNTGQSKTDIDLSFINKEGVLVGSSSLLDMEPGRPFAEVTNNLVSSELQEVMMLASSEQQVTGVSFVFDSAYLETAIGNVSSWIAQDEVLEKTLVYPWISNRASFYESLLVANNTGNQDITVSLTGRRESGDTESVTRFIQAGGFLSEKASSLFPVLGDGAGYAVELISPVSQIQGQWLTYSLQSASGHSPSQGVAVECPSEGLPTERAGTQILFGFLPQTDQFTSATVLINLGNQPTDVTLYYFDQNGTQIHSQAIDDLEPFTPIARMVSEYLPPEVSLTQAVAVSSGELITGVTFVINDVFLEPSIGNASAIQTPLNLQILKQK